MHGSTRVPNLGIWLLLYILTYSRYEKMQSWTKCFSLMIKEITLEVYMRYISFILTHNYETVGL